MNYRKIIRTFFVASLKKRSDQSSIRRASIDMDTVTVADLAIENFVAANTMKFFEVLFLKPNGTTDFLNIDPSCWLTDERYLSAEVVVNKILVVNDIAERAIGLMTRFNGRITNYEKEKQIVLQVVEQQ